VGSVSSYKITEKVHICPLCKGLGYVVDPVLNYQPNEVVLLHCGAVLSELLTNADNPSDFELRVKSALTLILLRKDLWEEIRDRRTGIEVKEPTPEMATTAADFGARLYFKSQSVLKTIERGRMSARICYSESQQEQKTRSYLNRDSTASDVVQSPQTAGHSRPTMKYRSKESRKISAILGGTMGGGCASRRHSGAGVRERTTLTASSAIAIPPACTVRNPFTPKTTLFAPVVPSVVSSDLRSALLKTFLDTALLKGSASKVRSRCKGFNCRTAFLPSLILLLISCLIYCLCIVWKDADSKTGNASPK
jgi:hypothetical protein